MRNLSTTRMEAVSELLEAAALDGDLRLAFSGVANLLDGSMFQLFNFTRPEAPDMIVASDCGSVYDDYILRGWHELDIFSHRAARIARHGMIVTDAMVVSSDDRRRDMFFQDFCPKWDIGSFVAWTFDLGGEKWAYTLMPRSDVPPTAAEMTILKMMIPAANRASLLACSMKDVHVRGMAAGLEAGNRSALVIDHNGRVVWMSASAEGLIGQGFHLRDRRLFGVHPESDRELRKLAMYAGQSRQPVLENFFIWRAEGGRPILAMPLSLRDRGLIALPGARLVLMLVDLGARRPPSSDILRNAFGLTPTEARIAQRMAAGDSLQLISETLELQISTVRHMTKAIFAKTDTHRQSELAVLLAGIPPSGE